MAYDTSKDEELFSESVEVEFGTLKVSVFSYSGGEKKLQISRMKDTDGELAFAKLGRMSKKEFELILPLIAKAIEEM